MQLYDQSKVHLDSKLGDMLPVFKNSDKSDIQFKDLLSHYAGLQAWVPFYKARKSCPVFYIIYWTSLLFLRTIFDGSLFQVNFLLMKI